MSNAFYKLIKSKLYTNIHYNLEKKSKKYYNTHGSVHHYDSSNIHHVQLNANKHEDKSR